MRERARATPDNKENQERGKEKKKRQKKEKRKEKIADLTLPFTLTEPRRERAQQSFRECKTLLKGEGSLAAPASQVFGWNPFHSQR